MSKQKTERFVKVPYRFVRDLNPIELKIACLVLIATANKTVTAAYMAKVAGKERSYICKILNSLVKKNIVKKTIGADSITCYYSIAQ